MELLELKQLVMSEVIKHTQNNSPRKNRFDITIETGESWIFWAKGSINFGNDENGNFAIWEFCISDSGLQFPDFEGTLNQKYISEIEKYVTE